MKRWQVILLICFLNFSSFAVASAESDFTGKIVAGEVLKITAPYSATVEEIPCEAGEFVHTGDPLFRLSTEKVYAPCDGVVQGILVEEGDRLEGTSLFYKGAIYLEPHRQYILRANTGSAAGEVENKILHVGDTVYLRRNSDSNRRTGIGIITEISGKDFLVEVQSGEVRLEDVCYIYKNPSYDYDDRIGKGTVARNEPVALNGTGVVLKLLVQNGQSVKKGDLLMETAPDSAQGSDSAVVSPVNGILSVSNISIGSMVNQDQAVMEIWSEGSLEASIAVDEYDLADFEIGQRYMFTLDCDSSRRYEATVSEIGYLPIREGDKTSYEVRLSFDNDDFVRVGMSLSLLSN